ncbi:MAG: DNA-binding protein [Candidatus ainarchaeum sp.]|nr:DNA-binding protein [Candidatus ainarchaeum sp.]
MEYRKSGSTLVVRFEDGEELVSSFTKLCSSERITGGVVTAIGAVRDAEISVFNPATKTYAYVTVKENCEIVSLAGSASVLDGAPWPHLHIALARQDFSVVGGHLKKATVSPTCEMAITLVDRLERKRDAKSGLALLDLKK